MALAPTPENWLPAVLGDFDAFLKDHASCEKKASGMALAIASHYPDRPGLVSAMADLAVEELRHYRDVLRVMRGRGVNPGPDERDPYVRAMNAQIRRGADHYLLDRLLVAALVERRGAERFELIASALAEGAEPHDLAGFYRAIADSERRHWRLFVTLAEEHAGPEHVPGRLAELEAAEAHIMVAQTPRPALH